MSTARSYFLFFKKTRAADFASARSGMSILIFIFRIGLSILKKYIHLRFTILQIYVIRVGSLAVFNNEGR